MLFGIGSWQLISSPIQSLLVISSSPVLSQLTVSIAAGVILSSAVVEVLEASILGDEELELAFTLCQCVMEFIPRIPILLVDQRQS